MKIAIITLAASISLAGCSTFGLEHAPVVTEQPPRAVADVTSVLNNIKCDIQNYMVNNKKLTDSGRTFGGTLTFTIDRANSSGLDAAIGIPIASSIKLTAGAGNHKKVSFGEIVSLPFVVTYNDKGTLAACQKLNENFVNVGNRNTLKTFDKTGVPQKSFLTSPILGAALLKDQLTTILTGEPQITLTAIVFKGSIALTQSTTMKGGINVLTFVDLSASSQIEADYKIDYEIGSNYTDILKKANFPTGEVPKPTAAPAPQKVEVYFPVAATAPVAGGGGHGKKEPAKQPVIVMPVGPLEPLIKIDPTLKPNLPPESEAAVTPQ